MPLGPPAGGMNRSLIQECGMQDNCAKQGLQPLEAFIDKIIQLYEMIVVRHGLMLVGQSYGMKTAAHKVLAAALSDLHGKVGYATYVLFNICASLTATCRLHDKEQGFKSACMSTLKSLRSINWQLQNAINTFVLLFCNLKTVVIITNNDE